MCRRFKFKIDESKHLEVYKGNTIKDDFDVTVDTKAYGIINLKDKPTLSLMTFGFKGFDDSLIYNARSETVMLKEYFKDDFLHRKVIFPCTSFFETDRKGVDHEFIEDDHSILYLAGFYSEDNRFVILTEEPCEEVRRYHPRMPLLIKEESIDEYLSPYSNLLKILIQERPHIHRRGEWVQLSLF